MFRFFVCSAFFFSDVFQGEFWSQRESFASPRLQELADSLPSFVLSSRATSTNVKYKNAWLSWRRWEKFHVGKNTFPVSPFLLCLYLRDKVEHCNTSSPIMNALYGIRWAHQLSGVPSPSDSVMVKQVVEACKRIVGRPVKGKDPLDLNVITRVCEKFHSVGCSLSNLRICFIFVMAFAGLLRCDEIIHITRRDIAMFGDHMEIFCPKRKNDQYRRGHTVFLARSNKITCPVTITEKLLCCLPRSLDQSLVCSLSSSGSPLKSSISYSRVREIFRETLVSLDVDPNRFGVHSLKKGGATAAVEAGISGEKLDRHAGWRCDKSKNSYVQYSIDDRLSVSRAINL